MWPVTGDKMPLPCVSQSDEEQVCLKHHTLNNKIGVLGWEPLILFYFSQQAEDFQRVFDYKAKKFKEMQDVV